MRNLLLLFGFIFLFAGCEGPAGPMGPPGPEGPGSSGGYFFTQPFTIFAEDWKVYGNLGDIGSYYYYDFRLNELTTEIYEAGAVVGYIVASGKKEPLPFTEFNVSILNDNTEFYWATNHTFEAWPGFVRLKIYYSDYHTELGDPGDRDYDILLMNKR